VITIERKIIIDEDRTLHVTLPAQVPVGNAEILIVVNPEHTTPPSVKKTLWDSYGVMKNSPNFNEDPVVIQKRLRDEWNDRLPA
jgi:hypothetical protein